MGWRKTDSDYKFIEDEVRLYPHYKKKLLQAVNDMIYSSPVRDENGGGKSNLPSRPVENIVFNLLHDTRINRLQMYVDAVETAFNELDEEKQRFIRLTYWTGGRTNQSVCKQMGISEATFNRWKKAFLLRVGMITGDKRDMEMRL